MYVEPLGEHIILILYNTDQWSPTLSSIAQCNLEWDHQGHMICMDGCPPNQIAVMCMALIVWPSYVRPNSCGSLMCGPSLCDTIWLSIFHYSKHTIFAKLSVFHLVQFDFLTFMLYNFTLFFYFKSKAVFLIFYIPHKQINQKVNLIFHWVSTKHFNSYVCNYKPSHLRMIVNSLWPQPWHNAIDFRRIFCYGI